MGIFDSNSEDEVKISPSEEEQESRLKNQVESEIVDDSDETGSKNRFSTNSSSSSDTGRSRRSSNDVSLEDIHRQNERIIELLEEISGSETDKNDEENFSGDLNGVL